MSKLILESHNRSYKKQVASNIVSLIPEHGVYIEPYGGCCPVFFEKDLVKLNVINDIRNNVVNFYKQIKSNSIQDIRLKIEELSKNDDKYLSIIKYRGIADDLTDAAAMYYAIKGSFCDEVETILNEMIYKIDHAQIDFIKPLVCIERYDSEKSFFYIDLPYYDAIVPTPMDVSIDGVDLIDRTIEDESRFINGITLNDLKKLLEILESIKGKYILNCSCGPAWDKHLRQGPKLCTELIYDFVEKNKLSIINSEKPFSKIFLGKNVTISNLDKLS